MSKRFLLIILFLLSGRLIVADVPQKEKTVKPVTDTDEIDLEELLNTPVIQVTRLGTNQQETPGTITVITDVEIEQSGARDLMDVLRLVPGVDFGVDVEGQVGIAIRGLWAHEGKALLLVDGQEFNEPLYNTNQFGGHFPVAQIKRIEVIRGPGGMAELASSRTTDLAIINIVTRAAAEFQGVNLAASCSVMAETFAERSVSIAAGHQRGDYGIKMVLAASQGNRSSRDFTDYYGDTYGMAENSRLDNLFASLGVQAKGLRIQFLLDRYHTTERDLIYINTPEAIKTDFNSIFLEAKYEYRLNERLTLTPRFNFRRQEPWQSKDELTRRLQEEDPAAWSAFYDSTVSRYSTDLTLAYRPAGSFSLLTGLEFFGDRARSDPGTGEVVQLRQHNSSFFAQGHFKTKLADFFAGARVDHHNLFGTRFVPRLGATKVWGKYHLKVFASQSFRAPSLENLNLNPSIKPEKAFSIDVEAGCRPVPGMMLTLNLFDIRFKKSIIYFFDTTDPEAVETYINGGQTGTRGVELEYRWEGERGSLNSSWSYYRAGRNEVEAYRVSGHPELLLGFPAHKLALNGHIKIWRNLSFNPSLVWYSQRFGYAGLDETEENPVLSRFEPAALVNVNFLYRDLRIKGLNLSIGGFNLLDRDHRFIQPYQHGWHAPLPDRSRRLTLSLSYTLN